MGFKPTNVSALDGLRHETDFGLERVQFKLSFGPRRVLARHRFWIGTGSVREPFRIEPFRREPFRRISFRPIPFG
ncbi:hypothetical protein Hanom_Chr14g01279191 [Helianthus anomalus]